VIIMSQQSYSDFSKIWLQSLMTLRGNGGVLLDRDYSIMVDNIKEYQLRVLHSLTVVNKPEEVDNSKLLTLIETQRILHQLQDMTFEDNGLKEIIQDLYKTNHAVLRKYGLDEALQQELATSPSDVESKQSFFDELVDTQLNKMVNDFKEKEIQHLSEKAGYIAESVLLGIPRKYLKTSQETGDERLYRVLESIRQEQLESEERQDLSLLQQCENIAEYKQRKEKQLKDTLGSVADCLIRNNEKEKLLTQKRRGGLCCD
jgi:hypothetical protein